MARRLARSLAILLFLGLIAAGLTYVRLLYGPVSLRILAEPIATGLGEELGGMRARIDDVQVRLTDEYGLEFGLAGVDIRDPEGVPLISTPWAAVRLAPRALLSLRVAPERISLAAPRLHLFHAEDGSLSLRVHAGVDPVEGDKSFGGAIAQSVPGLPTGPNGSSGSAALGRIDLIKVLADTSARARRREAASSYLREISLKDVRAVVEQGTRKTIWNIPDVSLNLDHRRARSAISGAMTIASLAGPWKLAFNTYENEQADKLQLDLRITDLVPHAIARTAPSFAVLEGLQVPISGVATLEVTRAGAVETGKMTLTLAPGRLRSPWLGAAPLAIESGSVELGYTDVDRTFRIAALQIATPERQLRLAGQIVHQIRQSAAGPAWTFDLTTKDAGGPAPIGTGPQPLQMSARGAWSPDDGRIALTELFMRYGTGEISATGEAADLTGAPRAHLEGQIKPMSVAAFAALWPQDIAPAARGWIEKNVSKGQILNGNFRLATAAGRDDGVVSEAPRVTLGLETSGLVAVIAKGGPAIEIPRALLRLEGDALEITAPDVAFALPDGRRLAVKSARVTAVDITSERPTAEVSARSQGALGILADMLDREPLNTFKSHGIAIAGLEGKFDTQLKMTFPIIETVTLDDVRFEGKTRITDGRLRQVAGAYDVAGANFTIDATDKAIDLKGDMLVKGVLARLTWQRVASVPPERQPPLRVTATLDNSDRTALGLDINDIVQGEVPVEITVSRETGKAEPLVRVRADLTRAEMLIDAIAWSKPPGRTAAFQFDFTKGAQGRTELQNVKLAGDNIAVEGTMVLGPDQKLREFAYPNFSVNVISRLDVHGKLRPDNMWEVVAKGPTYDGRDLFREIFSLNKKPVLEPPKKDRPGLDLTAEVDTVIGFSETSLKSVRVRAVRHGEKLTALDFRGLHPGNRQEPAKQFIAVIDEKAGPLRQLRAESWDAGQTFKLVGFYPNAIGGHMKLQVNLDNKGAAEKTGVLWTENFAVLGDAIVGEVLQGADAGKPAIGVGGVRSRSRADRQRFDFDEMSAPFSIGYGQFVLEQAQIKGPLVGATVRGKVDFKQQTLSIGGTYVPLSGLNSALGGIPALGQLLAGPQGEGIFGITFAVQGSMSQPQVIVNPFSLLTPGLLREIFQLTPYDPRVQVRDEKPAPKSKGDPSRSSSTPAVPTPAPARPSDARQRAATPQVGDGGWSSETKPSAPRPPAKAE